MPSYSDVTLDHFYNPRNGRKLAHADVVGRAGDPAKGGPYMVLYLRFAGEKIAEATFQTYGCCAAIAAASVLTERLTGSTRDDATRWDEQAINDALGSLPMEKRHCSALAATVLQDALGRSRTTTEAGPTCDTGSTRGSH